jgi:hypothetical protein
LLRGIGSGSTFTVRGRFFMVKVTHEVILDREHRIKPGFQDYVRYECRNDFPGRVEVLPLTGGAERARASSKGGTDTRDGRARD